MRLLFLTIMASYVLISGKVAYAGPQFLDFSINAAEYAPGEKAVLAAYLKIKPSNDSVEVYLESSLDENPIQILQLADDLAVSITEPLSVVGVHNWKVNAYIQDKKLAQAYRESIFQYQLMIDEIEKNIREAVTPDVILGLQAEKSEKLALIDSIRLMEAKNRKQVASQVYSINVSAAPLVLSPLLNVTASNPLAKFYVGESAMFYGTLTTDFTNSDGPLEAKVVTSATNGASQMSFVTSKMDSRYFSFQSEKLISSQLGIWDISFQVQLRSQKKADAIKKVIIAANTRMTDFKNSANVRSDPLSKAYFLSRASDMQKAISLLSFILSDSWKNFAETIDSKFTVEAIR